MHVLLYHFALIQNVGHYVGRNNKSTIYLIILKKKIICKKYFAHQYSVPSTDVQIEQFFLEKKWRDELVDHEMDL